MELIYAWIGEFRSYKNVGINFSNKFIVNYNNDDKTINITRNKDYCSIYPDYITNINAIVGKQSIINSIMKSSTYDSGFTKSNLIYGSSL